MNSQCAYKSIIQDSYTGSPKIFYCNKLAIVPPHQSLASLKFDHDSDKFFDFVKPLGGNYDS